MCWANLQKTIGSTCKADKWRAGKGCSLVKGGPGNVWGPALLWPACRRGRWCSGSECKRAASQCVTLGWVRAHLAFCLLHHWPLTKLAGIVPGCWTKRENSYQKEFFLSVDIVLPLVLLFIWHILHFFIPQTVRSSSYTNPQDARYTVPKMTGQNCGGDKSYRAT